MPLASAAILTGLTAGAAVLPDIDHPSSTLARSFGFLTRSAAWTVGKVSGGHRHGTHSLMGAAVFTGLAWLMVHYRAHAGVRWALGAFLALLIASGLAALNHRAGHLADALAIGAAVAMVVTGTGLGFVALATGTGCLAHLAGDALTVEGIPALLPVSPRRFRLLPSPLSFTTGTWRETWVADPLLLAALGWLAWHAAR